MANKDLKNRHAFSNSLDNKLWEKITEINKNTGIPLSKLLDKAVELLLKEHKK